MTAPTIVMTLLVRDEADVIASHLDFHLNAGVDVVIVTDNGSVDATPDILARYAERGVVHVFREPVGEYRQQAWVTSMARLAATEFDADWVINSDADEFWWPRGRSLKEVLARVPSPYGIVQGIIRNFIPVPSADGPFYERMVYRLSPQAPINDPTSPWRPYRKMIHRGSAAVEVSPGSHSVHSTPFRLLRGWYPVEVLHFPMRSPEQLERKGAAWASASDRFYGQASTGADPPPGTAYHALAYAAASEGTSRELFAALGVDPADLAAGVEHGILTEDLRLRDALRAVRAATGTAAADGLSLPAPTVVDDALFAVDAAVLGEADVTRIQRSLDELEARFPVLESSALVRVERSLRTLLRRWLRRAVSEGDGR